MKKILGLMFLLTIIACKSKAVVATAKATDEVPVSEVVAGHYANEMNFRTVHIKADARYDDANTTQNVSADIRILKGEKILVSVRFLGITMAKAMITPDRVQYYEKINGEYFDGDFTTLSRWLGTDLDYQKVENLFFGKALDDLREFPAQVVIDDKYYKIETLTSGIKKTFFFEGAKYLLKRQEIGQPSSDRTMSARYPDYREYPQAILPAGLVIDASQKKGKVNIRVDYGSVSFPDDLSFPYSVPEGYDRIYID